MSYSHAIFSIGLWLKSQIRNGGFISNALIGLNVMTAPGNNERKDKIGNFMFSSLMSLGKTNAFWPIPQFAGQVVSPPGLSAKAGQVVCEVDPALICKAIP